MSGMLREQTDVDNEISCIKDNTPGNYHDKDGCFEGQFCKIL